MSNGEAVRRAKRRSDSRGRRVSLLLGAIGAVLGLVVLDTPSAARLPAEFVSCLVVPGVLYFRGFTRFRDLTVRIGFSLIGVIASWTAVSTVVLALGSGLSDISAAAMLLLVYSLSMSVALLLRRSSVESPTAG